MSKSDRKRQRTRKQRLTLSAKKAISRGDTGCGLLFIPAQAYTGPCYQLVKLAPK